MNIVVCMKQAPDTEAKIKVRDDGSGIEEQGIKYVMNPYDEYGVEEALKLKEKFGGETVVVTMGPKRVIEAMRTALAMGIDKGVHIDDPAFEGSDSLGTARALAAVLKGMEYDLILGGKQAIDGDCAQVLTSVAELLDIPQVNIVTELNVAEDGKSATAHRRIEGGEEVVEVKLPAVMSCEKGLNEPRYASLPGIMKAKKKEIKEVALADSGLNADEVGKAGAKTKITAYLPLAERQPGKKLEGVEPDESAKQLVKYLREEAKVI